MKKEHLSEIKAIIILAVGMILFASLVSFVPEDLPWYTSHPNVPAHNLIRGFGAYTGGSLLFLLGYSAYFLVVFLFFLSWHTFNLREVRFSVYKLISSLVLFCVVGSLFAMIGPQESVARFQRAGMVGIVFSDFLVKYLGLMGAYIILFMLGTLSLILTGEFLLSPFLASGIDWLRDFPKVIKEKFEQKKSAFPASGPKTNLERLLERNKLKRILKSQGKEDAGDENQIRQKKEFKEPPPAPQRTAVPPPLKPKINITRPEEKEETLLEPEPQSAGEYKLPSLELLKDPPQISAAKMQSTLMGGAKLLEETLANFGVIARVADIERGPAITRFELEPAPGVKVQKFTTLADDIALAMRAASVRIVAPIPGKNRVGIEVPNGASAAVYLKEVLNSSPFRSSESKLMLALGKDIGGKPIIADLAEMPHLLIAGTTGSGKSVCVNGIIMSLLFNASPDEVKFVMIDPKMVELSQFNEIPHLLSPTLTDPQKAAGVLHWVVSEMEQRYKKLSSEGVKNIRGFNSRGHKMPYIVIIIDELADLMQVSAKTVESSITRLAQLSRAVGIHLILATQRPSVDVITGVIKANFPARISFKVASKVDSRTVLDMNGAESLLGRGDMLFIKPGDPKPTRGQCSFVNEEEISQVLAFIKEQQEPIYDESILNPPKGGGQGGSEETDEYYDEAVRLVIETNQASVSILQRRLRLGYTRAARLIDMMEQNGIVGPYCGSKPRDILVDREQWLLANMQGKEEKK